MWVPGKTSSLCSKHFTADDFERPLNIMGIVMGTLRRLAERDDTLSVNY